MKNKWKIEKSRIVALVYISESEIKRVMPTFDREFQQQFPEEFKDILNILGMDTETPFEIQPNIQHRNRFNEVVICDRFVGNERIDPNWINSGYASKEAKDKASSNKILDDIYRSKLLTEDIQLSLEERDKYSTIDESEWK